MIMVALIVGGLLLLFAGGEMLVRGSVGVARRLGMSELLIGLTLVIASDGALAGVISERDVVRALYEHGNHALNMPVDMFMARDVLTCSDQDKVEDVARLMAEKHIRHLPIVEDGYLAGMISATDLVRHFASKA